jgi:hypothetical protein
MAVEGLASTEFEMVTSGRRIFEREADRDRHLRTMAEATTAA